MIFSLRQSAHHGYVQTHRANLNERFVDIVQTWHEAKPLLHDILQNNDIARMKIIVCFNIIFVKYFEAIDERRETFYFCSRAERVLSSYFINEALDRCFSKISVSIDNFLKNGSGWAILHIQFIDLHVGIYHGEPWGGCANVELPDELKKKRCIININCRDDKCFLHCVCAKLFSGKKIANTAKTKFFSRLNTSRLSFPVALDQIVPFAKQNNLCINVYGYLQKNIFPIKLMSRENRDDKKVIDLLLFCNHFFLINKFNRLFSDGKKSRYYCRSCLVGFRRKETLRRHVDLCNNNSPQKVSMPADSTLKFKNFSKMLRHPFVIYADFECLTEKISESLEEMLDGSSNRSFSERIELHKPISYALVALNVHSDIIFHEYYVGEDAVHNFLTTLINVSNKLIKKMKDVIPMRTSGNYNSQMCVLCGEPFLQGQIRVRHHEHYINDGEIVGLAHQKCNLNYRSTYFIPVLLHNLKGYDSHLILKNLTSEYAKKVQILPTNMQKFISFSLDHIRFLDSLEFLDVSLDALVQNLGNRDFKILESVYAKGVDLLKRKGIFPYGYFDSVNILNEKSLPPIEAFKNILTGNNISDEEYEHAKNVFNFFKCKTFADYLELYQNVDTLLLAEVFESFREMILTNYQLDPLHYFTLPQLTFDAGLKYCKVEIELLKDVNQYIWLENQMRGGICMLNKRYVRANNELVGYKPKQLKNYILPLDVTNLYGHVLCQHLPLCNFSWLNSDEIESFDVSKISFDSPVGYILDVDLDYPRYYMDSHKDFPLAPEHLMLTYDHLSSYNKKLCDELNLRGTYPCKKLIPNFYPKRNYVTHYMNLKFYLENKMVLRKIHRILAFSQKPFLKDYIQFNNGKRTLCTNEFERSFFKKLNNSFFGKTMENCRKKLNIRAAFTDEKCKNLLKSPLLENFEIVNPDFTIFKLGKTNLILNKPIFIGFAVLELSKLRMYELFYDNFKKFYKERCELLYIDTDSLYINIYTKNLNEDLQKHFSSVIDFSNFSKNHPLYDNSKQGQLGLLKFETTEPVTGFVGLRPKMYIYETLSSLKRTAKGIKKNNVQKFTFNNYKDVLMNRSYTRELQFSLISKKHVMYTQVQNKIGLSSFYDKKFILNNIESLPYGHFNAVDSD